MFDTSSGDSSRKGSQIQRRVCTLGLSKWNQPHSETRKRRLREAHSVHPTIAIEGSQRNTILSVWPWSTTPKPQLDTHCNVTDTNALLRHTCTEVCWTRKQATFFWALMGPRLHCICNCVDPGEERWSYFVWILSMCDSWQKKAHKGCACLWDYIVSGRIQAKVINS